MDVKILVKSEAIIASCEVKIARIIVERGRLRDEWIAEQMKQPPFFEWLLLGARRMTEEEARNRATELGRTGRPVWSTWGEDNAASCRVLAAMARHQPYLCLDYDAFRVAGLHNMPPEELVK